MLIRTFILALLLVFIPFHMADGRGGRGGGGRGGGFSRGGSRGVDPAWGQSATVEAPAAAAGIIPVPDPTVRAGRVPYPAAANGSL